MPKFKITIERKIERRETATLVVDAPTNEAARSIVEKTLPDNEDNLQWYCQPHPGGSQYDKKGEPFFRNVQKLTGEPR